MSEEVTISVRAERGEVTVDVAVPVIEGRVDGLGELVDRLIRSAGAHAAVTNAETDPLPEIVAMVEPRLDAFAGQLEKLADWLGKVEKDLDARIDYALRQLRAIDAPRGDDLVAIERSQAIKADVLAWLAVRAGRWYARNTISTGSGWWPDEELESCLHELAAAGDLEHKVGEYRTHLWRVPQEEVIDAGVEETHTNQEV